jgi:nucleoside diphosphate kinase
MHRNQALTFVKPHAVRCQAALTYILDTFEDHDIKVLERRTVPAETILAEGLIDRHYAANARRGTFDNAMALELKDEAKAVFCTAFEEDWDEAVSAGRVFSGEAMRLKLGNISGEELNTLWARYGARKLSGGCYASWFEEQGCYVVNGFYPSIREQFTRPGAAVDILVVAFDLPWAGFRRDIIGSTNPAAADEASIRGYVHDHAQALGLVVDSRDNVIHASASPFEALCECLIWLPDRTLAQDPLWKLLHKKTDLAPKALAEKLLAWHAANPIVEVPDHIGPLLDVLEDRDTPDVAADLLYLLNPA